MLRPHLSAYWTIPPKQSGQFVARMEDVLEVYHRPYDRSRPIICRDKKPLQLLEEVRDPIPMNTGRSRKIDSEYKGKGTCSSFMFVEPLAGFRR